MIGSLILSYTGYVAKQAQTEFALQGIMWAFAIIPGLCYLLVALASLKLKLTEDYVVSLQGEIQDRLHRQAGGASADSS